MLTGKIEITKEIPFANCKLNRAKNAEVLNTIIENYKDGFVLTIDGAWGTGKSTFIEMWNKELQGKGYQTIHFNAWENDFDSNPLTSLLGEINDLLGKEPENGKSARFLNIAKQATMSAAPSMVKALIKNFTGIDTGEIYDNFSNGIVKAYEKDITDYKDKKNNLSKFKAELEEFIPEFCNKKPLIFFVDELDRCRPDYAVEVLEKIKHFFSVKGIIFVLAIDKTQLSNSIRGYYGSDLIDADEYLRRFIDIEYVLPTPDYKVFCDYLYSKMNLEELLDIHKNNDSQRNIDADFKNLAPLLVESSNLTLRQIEKLFVHTTLAIRSLNNGSDFYSEIILLLSYLKNHQPAFYKKLQLKELSVQMFIVEIENILPNPISNNKEYDEITPLISAKVILLSLYSKLIKVSLFTHDYKVNIVWNRVDSNWLRDMFLIAKTKEVNLSTLYAKIDLLENLKI